MTLFSDYKTVQEDAEGVRRGLLEISLRQVKYGPHRFLTPLPEYTGGT